MNKPDRKHTPRPSTPPVEAPILVNHKSGKVASVDNNRMKAIGLDVLDKKAKRSLFGIETLLEPDAAEAEQLERLKEHNDVVRKPLRRGGRLPGRQRQLAEDDALWDAIREAYCNEYPNRQWPPTAEHLSDWLQRRTREPGPVHDLFASNRYSSLVGGLDDEGRPQLAQGERWWQDRMAARRKREQSLVREIGETKSGSGDSLQS